MKSIISKIALALAAAAAMSCSSFNCLEAWKSFPLNADTDFAQLEEQIAANPEQWKAAYEFIKSNDFATLSLGRHQIVPDGAYANVLEYVSDTTARFEAHRDYIDVQIIVSGEENICVAKLDDAIECTTEYSKEQDVVFYATADNIRSYDADSAGWYIFFPSDLHRPGYARVDAPCSMRKVVVKIPVKK